MAHFIKNRLGAIGNAFNGLRMAIIKETHLKIHFLIALCVIAFGFYFSVSKTEWLIILTCITLVISLEMINSAIEKLCNRLVPEKDEAIKYVKDVAAGAVLIACLFAVIAGILLFYPYIRHFFTVDFTG